MDLPRPHPGQKSKPRFLMGQMEKWAGVCVSMKANITRPENQEMASKGIRFNILEE